MATETPPSLCLEVGFETHASSEQALEQWQENTLLLLHQQTHSLIKVYIGEILLGEGRLVTSQGKYAIQLIRLF